MIEPLGHDAVLLVVRTALGDGYEIRGLLGQGGFGLVYAAHDRALKRDVAVKVLRPDFHGVAGARQRFRREAESAARLRHPNVMPIYAVGENDQIAWLVMPLVAGQSLSARLRQEGALPVAEVRRILMEAAGALAVAHRAGIVHRDIKPDNILLDGEEQRVLLTDFGIAKAVDQATQALTQTGAIIGSPQYMSPEQASGDRAIDHRTDLYSLGIVAYEMLAGQLPFAGPTVAALLVKQLSEEAPPVTRARPDCPGDLAAIVTRCLAKSPEERFGSAAELARALADTSPATPRPSGAARAAAPGQVARFRRSLRYAGAAVGVALVIDVLLGRVLIFPPALVVVAAVAAAQYGRLWTAGYSWADVLADRPGSGRSDTPDSAEFGAYAEVLRQARSDRAAMLGVIEQRPKAERSRFRDVIPTADQLIARATELARRLGEIERQIDPGPEELERRAAAVRAEPASPGRNQRLAVLERRRESVARLATSRDSAREELDETLEQLREIQAGLERGVRGEAR